MKQNKKTLIAFLLPAMIFFTTVFVYPVIRTALMSLYEIDNVTAKVSQWRFSGIENYIKLMNTPVFHSALWNLLKIWLIGGVAVMGLSLFFAVVLSSGVKGKKVFRAILYFPNIVSAVALAVMWQQYVYSSKFGLLKPLAEFFGWQWLDPDHKFAAMLIAYCFGMVGYHMLIFLSGIERIGQQYFEAATIDGANRFKQFLFITLPLLRGVFKTNITMWSVSSIGFFVWSQLFAGTGVAIEASLITPLAYLYNQTFSNTDVVVERNAGVGAAVGVVMAVLVVIVFWITSKLISDDDIEF